MLETLTKPHKPADSEATVDYGARRQGFCRTCTRSATRSCFLLHPAWYCPTSPHNYPCLHEPQGQTMTNSTETAILAGGCFWGMQDLLRRYPGVLRTRVGYTGGEVPNATYRNHGNHAEAIEIVFDPAVISYRQILEFFFQIHDPSTPNRQGNDLGPSYRSAIYYLSEQQRDIAEDTAADVDASKLWPGRVVTQIEPAREFWEAEPEHQDYLERIPNGYTCHFIRPNWKLPKRA
ncbi:Peptide methionine sulfoxide reductase MsrA [Pseudomonas savastanoi pv. retacarpa]|nr:Peptide methionine sulfoxide reductase MsrA [Pseudomonas savastanoi pv. retacarpa]RML20510.1 Peptide methionine sulfoxide reductase MsrA [Pseudomonas savastanoi pv. retacarpa]